MRGQQQIRKVRKEDEAALIEDEGAEIHNGCDYQTELGAFLNFVKFRKFCVRKAVTDFGPYGGVPFEGSAEGVEVEEA